MLLKSQELSMKKTTVVRQQGPSCNLDAAGDPIPVRHARVAVDLDAEQPHPAQPPTKKKVQAGR